MPSDFSPTAYHPSRPGLLGAHFDEGNGSCRFLVWAPLAHRLELCLHGPPDRQLPMHRGDHGYYELCLPDILPGTRYAFSIDGQTERPDPASRSQPEGVHAPSAVTDPVFPWTDQAWHGLPLHRYILYELHVGTFSPAGDFAGVAAQLDRLSDLGITALEIMPVAQFPGARNWGYDGVYPFAAQNSYGGPTALKRLVDASHARGLAVVLDVVFNHSGPEGNYLSEFGPYFTTRYQTPWGAAINFDGPGSDDVRRFFLECALHWIRDFHIDALRLDAVHAIFDCSAHPFLRELADTVRWEGERLNRRVYTIAETSRNDSTLLRSKELGGIGIDAQWCDDFHHALRTELTGERAAYYQDYHGFTDIVKCLRDGYVLDGRYSTFYQRRHGNPVRDLDPGRLVVFSQNHDQVGNRMLGERLSELLSFEPLKLTAGLVMLSPGLPLLFMGEEYGETARFAYFVSHEDPGLAAKVMQGRQEEFAGFHGDQALPNPLDEETFLRSQLNPQLQEQGQHRVLRAFYKRLIALRLGHPLCLHSTRERTAISILEPGRTLALLRWSAEQELLTVFHFGADPIRVRTPASEGCWEVVLDSAHPCWGGPGSALPNRITCQSAMPLTLAPFSVVVLQNTVR